MRSRSDLSHRGEEAGEGRMGGGGEEKREQEMKSRLGAWGLLWH